MNCLHCGSDCKKNSETNDMPLSHLLPVLNEIKLNQPSVKTIVFTVGGEPLVRNDIFNCGREITKKGFYWGMVSNGQLIDASTMRELSNNGLCSLSIDIDGLRDSHNWLRQSPISFDKIFNAIEYIRDAPHLIWDVITCVNRRNLNQLRQLKKLLIEAGVKRWRSFTIVPMGRAKKNNDLQLSDPEFKDLMEFIKETRYEGKIDLSYACEGYLGEYEMKVRKHNFKCVAGINTASILTNGDISGCLSIRSQYNQGNIYHDSFWDIWTNRFEKYRNHDWMRTGECKDCQVFEKCQGNGMHLRNDDGSLMNCHYKRICS